MGARRGGGQALPWPGTRRSPGGGAAFKNDMAEFSCISRPHGSKASVVVVLCMSDVWGCLECVWVIDSDKGNAKSEADDARSPTTRARERDVSASISLPPPAQITNHCPPLFVHTLTTHSALYTRHRLRWKANLRGRRIERGASSPLLPPPPPLAIQERRNKTRSRRKAQWKRVVRLQAKPFLCPKRATKRGPGKRQAGGRRRRRLRGEVFLSAGQPAPAVEAAAAVAAAL